MPSANDTISDLWRAVDESGGLDHMPVTLLADVYEENDNPLLAAALRLLAERQMFPFKVAKGEIEFWLSTSLPGTSREDKERWENEKDEWHWFSRSWLECMKSEGNQYRAAHPEEVARSEFASLDESWVDLFVGKYPPEEEVPHSRYHNPSYYSLLMEPFPAPSKAYLSLASAMVVCGVVGGRPGLPEGGK